MYAAILLGTSVGKTVFDIEEAEAEKQALELKRKAEEINASKEALFRDQQLEKILSTQRAEGAARGIAPTSASLSAISQGTFNNFSDDAEARNLNLQMKESAIDIAEKNVKRTEMFKITGNLFDAANKFNDLKLPNNPSGTAGSNSLDEANRKQSDFELAGPLDLKQHNQEKINAEIGF